jgi:Cu(I)/Ag(I) efflux system periplasmic protein CusF
LPAGRRIAGAQTLPSLHHNRLGRRILADETLCLMHARRISMIARLYRLLVIGFFPIALIACMNSAPTSAEQSTAVPLGIDLGGSGPVIASPQPEASAHATHVADQAASAEHAGEMKMAHEGHNDAHGTGTVNSVDPGQHKLNMSHAPIPEIGWPAMTMEFPVAPSVDLKAIKPGTRVNFTIEKGQGGMYEIKAITPAGGSR